MLISRVADNCFWFGRYLERAEATARSLGSTREALMGAELDERQSWLPVIIAAGEQERFAKFHGGEDPPASEDGERVQSYMVWDERNPSSLRASIQALRWNARSIRDHLSEEAWEQINELHWWIGAPVEGPGRASARRAFAEDRHGFYDRITRSMALIAGLLQSTMLGDEPLDFISLGTMLERASQTARILDVQHHTLELGRPHVVIDTALWLALLRACAGYAPFMRRHRGRVSGKAVAAFLIQDTRFPRSIGFALEAALERLAALRPAGSSKLPGERSQRRLNELHEWLAAREPEELLSSEIHGVLTRVVDEVHGICQAIGAEFLGHEIQQSQSQSQSQT